jgi:hypothetical protein
MYLQQQQQQRRARTAGALHLDNALHVLQMKAALEPAVLVSKLMLYI